MTKRQKSKPAEEEHIRSRRDVVPYLALAIAVFAAYANVYHNQFLFDDEQFIVNNALLRSWGSIGAIFTSSGTAGAGLSDLFYRPLQALLYLVIYQSFGLSAVAFHFLNVALHAANAGLLYALGRRLGFKPAAVFLAALIWALHPLQTEAVAYMSSTIDPLYAFFSLIGLLVLLPDFTPQKILYACPFYALALLSKETAILFPLLAASCLFLASKDRLDPKIYLRLWPLAVVAAGYVLLRQAALGNGYDFYRQTNIYSEHIAYRVYTFLATLPLYAQLLAWPSCLHIDRAFPVFTGPGHWQVIAGAAMIAAACGQILWGRGRRGLPLSWGFLWFGCAHALHAGVLLPVNGFFFEHWMYMPTAGLCLGVAQSVALGIESAPRRDVLKRPAAILAALAAFALGIRTFDQNAYWREPIVFYYHIIDCGGTSARVHNNLANAYMENGELERAIEQFHIAINISDGYPQTHHNLALALLSLPDRTAHADEAIAELKHAITLDPDFFQSFEMLANIYAWRGDAAGEAFYRAKSDALRRKYKIPADVYAQPILGGIRDG